MNHYKFSHIIISTALFLFLSCDEIKEPFIEYTGQCGDASLPVPIKQILLEEFTGHECGNCPRGDEQVELIKAMYCDHVIPISVHAGFFAQVNETGKYTYDYRTTTGNEIDAFFDGSVSVPAALINRAPVNNDYTFSVSEWTGRISEILAEEPVIDINLELSYNSARDINIDVDVVFIKESDNTLMLSVYFIEDSIKSWQKDYSLPAGQQDIELYSHNHVLRDAINGTWGDQLTSGLVNANDVISKSFNYTINSEWIIKNSSIIAFVYDSDTKAILQASQIHLE